MCAWNVCHDHERLLYRRSVERHQAEVWLSVHRSRWYARWLDDQQRLHRYRDPARSWIYGQPWFLLGSVRCDSVFVGRYCPDGCQLSVRSKFFCFSGGAARLPFFFAKKKEKGVADLARDVLLAYKSQFVTYSRPNDFHSILWIGLIRGVRMNRNAAGKAAFPEKWRRPQAGFSLIELLVVVAIILIIAAIAIPSLVRAKMAANEAGAAESVRTITTGETTYAAACPDVGYSGSLMELNTGSSLCQWQEHYRRSARRCRSVVQERVQIHVRTIDGR